MSKPTLVFVVLATLLCVAFEPVAADDKRPVSVDDLASIKDVGAPQISPDGFWVAYSITEADVKADSSRSSIWLTSWDGSTHRQLTSDKTSAYSPRWSPDGKHIAFLAAGTEAASADQLWLVSRKGKNLQQVTNLEHGVFEYDWAPDSSRIALITDVAMDGYAEELAGGPFVIDRLQFRTDGVQYTPKTRSHLHLLDLDTGKVLQLTDGTHNEVLPSFSPDGQQIAYVTKLGDDPDRHDNWDILTVKPKTGAEPHLVSRSEFMECDPVWGWHWGGPDWSPDSQSITCIQSGDLKYSWFTLHQVVVFSADGGAGDQPTKLLDRNTTQPRFSRDGQRLFFHLEEDLTMQLASISKDGKDLQRLTPADHTVYDYDLGPDGKVAVLIGTSDAPAEISVLENGELRQLTHANADLLASVAMAKAEPLYFRSHDGTEISGLLMKPPNYQEGVAYPTIIRLHGGPQVQWQHEFDFTWQALAAAGYVVYGPNPRGGSGRGEEFQMAVFGQSGFADIPDVLAAADHLVAEGIADGERLGIGGYSYGAMLTNYAIASDTRFKAATSGAGISNMLAGYGTDEWTRDWEKELGLPWENTEKWLQISYPFLHADRIKTPTLFVASAQDYNVPVIHAEQMYSALKRLGIPAQLVVYPGQDHGLSQPAYARDVIKRYLSWYERWLKPDTEDDSIELRVMSFNIEWGGDNISFEKVIEAVRASNADIVGIQEPVRNLQRLAAELGWYFDEQTYVISRFPVLAAPDADRKYVFVEVGPGKMVAIANVHLPSDPDGMAMVRDGASAAEVLEVERSTRLPKILPYLESLRPLIENNIPVFLTGDFNAPSHMDWTENMVGERPFLLYPMQWPVSLAVTQAGLKDSYRDVYPDPQQHPGLTWWARRPPLAAYTPDENDPEERIDFLWYAGAVEVESSEIVGERGFPGVTISVDPWPTDHRGVLSQFSVTPAPLPPLVTTRHRVSRNSETIEVLYRKADDAIIRIHRVGSKNDPVFTLDGAVSGDGQFAITADQLPAGHHVLSMTQRNGADLTSELWVQDPAATPQVSISGRSFKAGESIDVAWQNGPGYRNDYLSIATSNSVADYDGGIAWLYVNALPNGKITLNASTVEFGWPVAPGNYVLRLLKDDGDEVLAESSVFTVR